MKFESTNSAAKVPQIGLLLALLCFSASGTVQAQNSTGGLLGGPSVAPASLVEPGTQNATSSPDSIWTQTRADFAPDPNAIINVIAVDPQEVVVDLDRLKTVLAQAPLDQPGVVEAQRPAPAYIYLPSPDGGYVKFSFRRSQLISLEMEGLYPDVTTYRGYAVNDPATTIALDLTPSGFHAQVLQPGKRWFIDPQFKENTLRYVSYYKARKGEDRQCLLDSTDQSALPQSPLENQSRSGDNLRTYTLAVATTGEYGQFFGGAAAAFSAIVTTVNRVTGIYEKELAITFTLITSVYDNPATDPFTGNNNAFVLINESQTVLDTDIGTANYDIGHTFSTGAGGLAGLGVVCNASQKARGVTGLSNPTGDVFDVDFVSHEIGHQFSGNHTFNGALGNCAGGNRNGSTAYEPGSGSTIQAYAGICGADNLQSNSDAQMHTMSHLEMISHVTVGSGSTCGTVTSLANTVPTVDAMADYAIPHSTPFILAGNGADPDFDPVTYSWEQLDLGPQATLVAPDDGQIPLFRVLPPSPSELRFFPNFAAVEAGTSDPSEKLPVLSRTMEFGLTARDNVGGVETDYMQVTVDGGSGPFVVTSPNGGETIMGNYLVTWDVAGTDGPTVSAGFVDIVLSTSGSGLSYNQTLAASTPNDGSELINFGAFNTTSARLMIINDNFAHSFYDISDATFTINPQTCNGMQVTVYLDHGDVPTSNPDVILGTSGADVINGMGGDDTICGLAGADIINGGRGFDWIDAGEGDDEVQGANDDDIIFGGPGNDDLFGGPNNDEIYGEAGDDLIYGNTGSDTIDGGDGVDNIRGGSGNDTIFTGSGATVGTGSLVDAGAGNDDIFGGPDADVIRGSTDSDTINGGDGDDQLYGGGGEDFIYGEEGADLMRGNGAADFLSGGLGADDINGFGSNDTIEGGDGNDILNGSTGNDDISGGSGNDSINGGGGNDELSGEADNDTILGGGGNDNMNGGTETDSCDGQSGIDTATQCEMINGVP